MAPATKPEMNVEDKEEERKPKVELQHVSEDELVMEELLRVDEQFAPLVELLEQFSPDDDGNAFNRKLKKLDTAIARMCRNKTRLHQAFAAFRAAALRRAATSRALAAVGACFRGAKMQLALRDALLYVVIEETYKRLDVLERNNPVFLINAANLLGEYFGEACMYKYKNLHMLARPLQQYLRALLACDDARAHRSLAKQLKANGRKLLAILPEDMEDLSISIRLRLMSPPSTSSSVLLYSLDLCINKFLQLPEALEEFYGARLDLTTEENCEISNGSWGENAEKEEMNRSEVSADVSEKVAQKLPQTSITDDGAKDRRPSKRVIQKRPKEFNSQGVFVQHFQHNRPPPERVNERQKSGSRRPVENWRKRD